MPAFEWVKARAGCSVAQMFQQLRLEVDSDIKTRLALRPAERHYVEGRSIAPITDGQPRIANQARISIRWERLSVSSFPYRHPILYALLLELRSSYHRIRLAWQRGGTREIQMGPTWQRLLSGHLIPNKQTQGRIEDMRRWLSSREWSSPEEWDVFLKGWDAGWVFRDRLDTEASSEDAARQRT